MDSTWARARRNSRAIAAGLRPDSNAASTSRSCPGVTGADRRGVCQSGALASGRSRRRTSAATASQSRSSCPLSRWHNARPRSAGSTCGTARPMSVVGPAAARIPDRRLARPDFPPDCAIASSFRLLRAAPAKRDAARAITAQQARAGHRVGGSPDVLYTGAGGSASLVAILARTRRRERGVWPEAWRRVDVRDLMRRWRRGLRRYRFATGSSRCDGTSCHTCSRIQPLKGSGPEWRGVLIIKRLQNAIRPLIAQ